MLDGGAATATAVALTPVEALIAGPADFRAIEGDPEIELRLKAASREVLSLPIYPELKEDHQVTVVRALADFYGTSGVSPTPL